MSHSAPEVSAFVPAGLARVRRKLRLLAMSTLTIALSVGCTTLGGAGQTASQSGGQITLYSGRAEPLVDPLIRQFERETGIKVNVRYAGSAPLAATIQEEGDATPADVFWSQDPGPLGALSPRFAQLPSGTLGLVENAGFKAADGRWVGLSGRVRVAVYNPDRVQPAQLPNSLQGLTNPTWRNRVGWVPTNGSFQIMLTAMRSLQGEDVARKWIEDMKNNGARAYGANPAALEAVAAGEVDVALINHYYLLAARRSTPNIKAENHYTSNPQDPGALVMVSGVGILSTSKNRPAAERFVDYMLSTPAQQYFATETAEYPVVRGVIPPAALLPLDQLLGPRVDFARLADLQGTLGLLRQAGVVQ